MGITAFQESKARSSDKAIDLIQLRPIDRVGPILTFDVGHISLQESLDDSYEKLEER